VRILHIGKFYPPFHGGIENFLAALVDAQTKAGHQVAALVHSHAPGGPSVRPPITSPFPWVVRAPCYGRLLYAPVSPTFAVWLAKTIADFQPDLLHLHLPNTSVFWALALPSARRLPWIIHWHSDVVGSDIDRRLKLAYAFYRPFEKALLHRASAIVATSPPYLASSQALGWWRQKCHIVPLGLPVLAGESEFFPVSPIEWAGSSLRVLAIGRLTYYKGFGTLIHAVAKQQNVQLVIVGEGELRSTLEAQVRLIGASDRIRLVGGLLDDQLRYLLKNCDVLALSSIERTEAFGVVLLEAMQYGKPIVASDIPGSGIRWVLDDGQAGVLVPPADVDSLASAIGQMSDKHTRAKFGKAGQERFSRYFRIDRITEALAIVYRSVIERQKRGKTK
jgi:rhamnosyl/mannosyltransferase